jgi:hypothetical protein
MSYIPSSAMPRARPSSPQEPARTRSWTDPRRLFGLAVIAAGALGVAGLVRALR